MRNDVTLRDMTTYEARALDAETWADFEKLADENNGVWGGCWCTWYHAEHARGGDTPESRRKAKAQLVRDGEAHASLVYENGACVGWCQFGSPKTLPRIHNQRAYLATDTALPDWRITCIFTGKGHRGAGAAAAALEGAIQQIQELGGGLVEGYPDDTESRRSSAFLFNGALSTFERLGFERSRKIGKHKWVVTRTVR